DKFDSRALLPRPVPAGLRGLLSRAGLCVLCAAEAWARAVPAVHLSAGCVRSNGCCIACRWFACPGPAQRSHPVRRARFDLRSHRHRRRRQPRAAATSPAGS
ncbi:MAG: Periplasmic thiol:disulfide oxidoreductase DsbB, required for DsbA reoxidation, partial [uncultured Lysobacter sp.]